MTDRVQVHIGTAQDMGQRFVDAWHRAEKGEALDEIHLTFHDLKSLLSALTPGRLDLLRYVRHHDVRSVQAVAEELRRDYDSVHKDVETLMELGLLTRTPDRVVAPFAEIDARFVL